MNGAFKEKYWLQWNRCHGAAPDFILALQPPGGLLRLLKMYDIAYAKHIILLGKNWLIGKRAVCDRQKAMLPAGIFLYGAPVALQQFAALAGTIRSARSRANLLALLMLNFCFTVR